MALTRKEAVTLITKELNECFAECKNREERRIFMAGVGLWADQMFYYGMGQFSLDVGPKLEEDILET